MTTQPQTFGNTIGFGNRPAVLVIDLCRAFTDPGRPLGVDCTSVIAQTNRILRAARDAGHPVIFSTVRYDSTDFSDAGIWGRKIGGHTDLGAEGDGPEIDSRLMMEPSDTLLVKKYASCFFGTDLSSRLVSQGVDTLVICGVTTSGCVRASTVDAIQCGFRPIVVPDAVGDRWPDAHDQSLRDMAAKYADLMGTDLVLTALSAAGLKARPAAQHVSSSGT
ncbi:MAG: isochorismatase family protein [Tabrizicola sp.]|nr:isochorismatase family protein [Tabrizicola sp.]